MTFTTKELVMARKAAAANAILEGLELDTYLDVEPQNVHYELKVECACETNGGWESISLTVPKEKMLTGFDDLKVKHQLFEYWNKKTCSLKTQAKLDGQIEIPRSEDSIGSRILINTYESTNDSHNVYYVKSMIAGKDTVLFLIVDHTREPDILCN
jgi:hypothetical protein